MNTNKLVLAFASLIAIGSLAPTAVASTNASVDDVVGVAASEGDVEIPTQLVNEPLNNDANGACSHCRVFPIKSAPTSGYEDATFDLYFADDGEDLLADIEVKVLLDSQQFRTVMLYDVELTDEVTDTHTVGSGSDWNWTDVAHAWVKVIPQS